MSRLRSEAVSLSAGPCVLSATKMNNYPSGQAGSRRGRCFGGKCSAGPGSIQRQRSMNSTGGNVHGIRLEKDERRHLKEILDSSRGSRERHRRAHVLLPADESRP